MNDFDDARPYTKEELAQQAIWADEFDSWWVSEGQYHRAGGNDYCRTFAWWAWLNREQSKQVEIEKLKAKVRAVEHVLDGAIIGPKEVFSYADRIRNALDNA